MRFYIFTACLLGLAAPAIAQSSDDGLSYTTMGARKERTGGHINYKALDYGEDGKKAGSGNMLKPYGAPEEEPPAEDEKAADEAWQRYKALAAGTYKEKPPAEKKQAVQPAKVQNEKPSGGLGAIIEEYQRNKEQRSQMRTIRVTPESEKAENTGEEKEDAEETEKE